MLCRCRLGRELLLKSSQWPQKALYSQVLGGRSRTKNREENERMKVGWGSFQGAKGPRAEGAGERGKGGGDRPRGRVALRCLWPPKLPDLPALPRSGWALAAAPTPGRGLISCQVQASAELSGLGPWVSARPTVTLSLGEACASSVFSVCCSLHPPCVAPSGRKVPKLMFSRKVRAAVWPSRTSQ